MFSQLYAPYYLAADFTVRLQREILIQWLNGWSGAVAAVVRAGHVQTEDEREPLTEERTG